MNKTQGAGCLPRRTISFNDGFAIVPFPIPSISFHPCLAGACPAATTCSKGREISRNQSRCQSLTLPAIGDVHLQLLSSGLSFMPAELDSEFFDPVLPIMRNDISPFHVISPRGTNAALYARRNFSRAAVHRHSLYEDKQD